jgi:hypothetical protein
LIAGRTNYTKKVKNDKDEEGSQKWLEIVVAYNKWVELIYHSLSLMP